MTTITSIRSDVAYHSGNIVSRFSRKVASKSTGRDRRFVYPVYLMALAFLGIIFPQVWTAEAGMAQTLVAGLAFLSYVVAIASLTYMVIIYAAKKNGWIA